jgi:hypothetical protein
MALDFEKSSPRFHRYFKFSYPTVVSLFLFFFSILVVFSRYSNSLKRWRRKSFYGKDSCDAVISRLIASKPAETWPPPCEIPKSQSDAFQGPDGSMPISKYWCLAQRYEGELIVDWNEKFVDEYCSGIRTGSNKGTYTLDDVDLVRDAFAHHLPGVTGSNGVVFGSEFPWVECLAIESGASAVWTFEYATIKSTHPRIFANPMKKMATDVHSGKQPQFDWAFTYSSLEHSGLGRYGDSLNPDGDRDAVQQAWCMLKPGGYFFLAVPTTCKLEGNLVFNAHRNYGFHRLAYITEGFEVVEMTRKCTDQSHFIAASIFVLRKPLTGEAASPILGEDFLKIQV